jgi:ubiquinone/menaquinone biosynthesis C-methylase UbiE
MNHLNVPNMPYVDFVLQELRAENQVVMDAWSRDLHWGYWETPNSPDVTVSGYAHAMQGLTRQHLLQVEIRSGQRIVDVGCGLGGTISLLNDEHQGLQLIGLNIDERQLAVAREKVRVREGSENTIEFIHGDACCLPFEDHSVDIILSIECIFHFSSRESYLAEVKRVLRPGGRLVVSDFVAKAWSIPFVIGLYLPHQQGVKRSYGDSGLPATPGVYRRLARRSGLTLRDVNDVTAHTMPNYQVLPRLVEGSPVEQDFRIGVRFLKLVTELGFYRYQILTFEA